MADEVLLEMIAQVLGKSIGDLSAEDVENGLNRIKERS